MMLEQRRLGMRMTMPQGLRALARGEDRPAGRRLRKGMALLGALGALALVVGLGVTARLRGEGSPGALEPDSPVRQVNVVKPERTAAGEVTLPATVQAYQWTDLHARVSGYLKAWKGDIGTRVKAGELLAEIDTPELDQELEQATALWKQGESELIQARAELEEARADVALAGANLTRARAQFDFSESQVRRNQRLLADNSVSREEFEAVARDHGTRRAEVEAAKADLNRRRTNLATRAAVIDSRKAMVDSRHANVRRLRELQGFKKVIAPFDGIVTRRSAEVGLLVGAGETSARPLFTVAQTNVLRVQAQVPQAYSAVVRAADEAVVSVPEHAGSFPAKVTRTAGAVDPSSRTLLVELELANADGLLLPGTYSQVRFRPRQSVRALVVPTAAVRMRPDGPQVVVVTAEGMLRPSKVSLGRDYGARVEVLSGLAGDESLVVNPADDLKEGEKVQVAAR